MKFAAMIIYSKNKEILLSIKPVHHEYMQSLLANEKLQAAGPLADDEGALWVLDAESLASAEDMIRADPYFKAGVFASWQIHPLAYWSAKENKGAR